MLPNMLIMQNAFMKTSVSGELLTYMLFRAYDLSLVAVLALT